MAIRAWDHFKANHNFQAALREYAGTDSTAGVARKFFEDLAKSRQFGKPQDISAIRECLKNEPDEGLLQEIYQLGLKWVFPNRSDLPPSITRGGNRDQMERILQTFQESDLDDRNKVVAWLLEVPLNEQLEVGALFLEALCAAQNDLHRTTFLTDAKWVAPEARLEVFRLAVSALRTTDKKWVRTLSNICWILERVPSVAQAEVVRQVMDMLPNGTQDEEEREESITHIREIPPKDRLAHLQVKNLVRSILMASQIPSTWWEWIEDRLAPISPPEKQLETLKLFVEMLQNFLSPDDALERLLVGWQQISKGTDLTIFQVAIPLLQDVDGEYKKFLILDKVFKASGVG